MLNHEQEAHCGVFATYATGFRCFMGDRIVRSDRVQRVQRVQAVENRLLQGRAGELCMDRSSQDRRGYPGRPGTAPATRQCGLCRARTGAAGKGAGYPNRIKGGSEPGRCRPLFALKNASSWNFYLYKKVKLFLFVGADTTLTIPFSYTVTS
jgi:hypothetical protein